VSEPSNIVPIRPNTAAVDIAFIRDEIKKTKGVSEGTVVRFDRVKRRRLRGGLPSVVTPEVQFEEFVTTYAALFVAGKWYLTGHESQTAMGSPYTNRQFFDDVIGAPETRNVEIASAWDAVEPEDQSA